MQTSGVQPKQGKRDKIESQLQKIFVGMNEHESKLYQVFVTDLLEFYRGKLSQRNFSTRLGYSYNIVHKWETGIREISWEELITVAQHKYPFDKFFDEIEDDPKKFHSLLEYILKYYSASDRRLMSISGASMRTVRNWKDGTSSPSAHMAFKIIHFLWPKALSNIIRVLVGDSVSESNTSLSVADQNEIKKPIGRFIPMMVEMLDLEEIKKSENQIYSLSRLLGLNEEFVEREISRAIDLGFLHYENGRLKISDVGVFNGYQNLDEAFKQSIFVASLSSLYNRSRIGKENPPIPGNTNQLFYWMTGLTEEADKKIVELTRDFAKKIEDIVIGDIGKTPKIKFKALHYHSFDVNDACSVAEAVENEQRFLH